MTLADTFSGLSVLLRAQYEACQAGCDIHDVLEINLEMIKYPEETSN